MLIIQANAFMAKRKRRRKKDFFLKLKVKQRNNHASMVFA
jgi:hypothetical protein